MNWSRAKTILIIFFICTNLFLFSVILISADRTSIVTDDIVSSTVSILKNNKVEIDPEIIPRKTSSVDMIEFENWISDYFEFAKKFVGEDAKKQTENTYVGANGKISFSGDEFTYHPATSIDTKTIIIKNHQVPEEKIALSVLEHFGFSDENLVIFKTENQNQKKITITKEKGTLSFYDCKIDMFISEEKIYKISGSWFFEGENLKEKFTVKNVTGVLIDYLSLTHRPKTEEKIVLIKLGYSSLEKGVYHKQIVAPPCWRFILSNGEEYTLHSSEI